jgi:hypothetical protein
LHDAVIEYTDAQVQNDFADADVRQLTTTDHRHGRVETRSYFHMPVPDMLANLELWKGMKSIGAVVATCELHGRETSEIRYTSAAFRSASSNLGPRCTVNPPHTWPRETVGRALCGARPGVGTVIVRGVRLRQS